ncbi:trk system potassium uptake protein TrkA [Arcanobacterium wilhelmae]|uniref:Trk system potassium uptake protein TrkA n=1 Tax=Arcanobacterium wilhelmae TaxID=1803177 RepID=A0ABT9N8W9_9ACTO|nr:TrkA family potassium uptake protein [Arcanobacterium wilhelmae]MDP9800152.1 trk system potassium uptake protein TrkA [Arcanobacterium wilhelmae]WFN89592.1 TrkA family potassium uptake protein [Arcanobacterium wilhelmae]
MKIVIAGAGSVGRSIARAMITRGDTVVLIDRNPSAMRVASVPQADWLLGDACEISVLNDAGVNETDVVVAATGDDKANLVLSLLSKTEFGVPRVIARNNNPANSWLFDESWGVDVAVSTPEILGSFIEDAMATGSLIRRLTFEDSTIALFQGTVAKNAPVDGRAVHEIELPLGSRISSIVRSGITVAPEPDIAVLSGDIILVEIDESTSGATAQVAAFIGQK